MIKKKLDQDEISLYDYTLYLKNKLVLESPSLTTMLLNSFCKKLYRNEGFNDEEDDLFRPIYIQTREKVRGILISRTEV